MMRVQAVRTAVSCYRTTSSKRAISVSSQESSALPCASLRCNRPRMQAVRAAVTQLKSMRSPPWCAG